MQRLIPTFRLCADICTGADESLHNVGVPALRNAVDCLSPILVLCIDFRARLDQDLHHLDVSVGGCSLQRLCAIDHLCAHVCTSVDEDLGYVGVPPVRRKVERLAPGPRVYRADVRTPCDARSDTFFRAFKDGQE